MTHDYKALTQTMTAEELATRIHHYNLSNAEAARKLKLTVSIRDNGNARKPTPFSTHLGRMMNGQRPVSQRVASQARLLFPLPGEENYKAPVE